MDVLDGVRGCALPEDTPVRAPVDGILDGVLAGLGQEVASSRYNLTLRELAEQAQEEERKQAAEAEAQRELALRDQGSPRSATT